MNNFLNMENILTAITELNNTMTKMGRDIDAENIAEIVIEHALIGAASGAAAAIVPGAGALIATGVAGSAVLAMYVRLSKELGITFGDGILKALASGLVADLSATVLANLGLAAAVSFIPGVGSASAGLLAAIANYGMVYLAAIIFINMLAALMGSGKDPSKMSESELKKAAKKASSNIDKKSILKEAKRQYKNNK